MSKRSSDSSGGSKKRKKKSDGSSSHASAREVVSSEEVKANDALNGWWKLDTKRSDTMEKYLMCMGLNPMAVEAALKGERDWPTLHRLEVNDSGYTIERRSRLSNTTLEIGFGDSTVSEMRYGQKEVTAKFDGKAFALETTTILPLQNMKMKIVDRRWVMKEVIKSSGDSKNPAPVKTMHQTLTATNLSSKGVVMTMRYYRQSTAPPDEGIEAPH